MSRRKPSVPQNTEYEDIRRPCKCCIQDADYADRSSCPIYRLQNVHSQLEPAEMIRSRPKTGGHSSNPANKSEPLLVTLKKAAFLLGCSRSELYKRIKRGEIKTVGDGRSRRISMAEILRYIRANER